MGEIDFENVGFGTLAIHAGQEPDGSRFSQSLQEMTLQSSVDLC